MSKFICKIEIEAFGNENDNKQTYCSTKVDWHKWMSGQEKIIQSNNGGKILEHVTIPRD